MTILRLALRDLRGAMGGFWLLILCVALGTAAMAATGLLSGMVLDGVQAGARAGIGGDVSLRLYHRPPPPEHLALFAEAGTASLTAELRPLAHGGAGGGAGAGGGSTLVEMKAVDAAYPLYGDVELEPPMPLAGALAARDGIWGAVVAEELLEALGLALGDRILVGGQAFEMRALIRAEPDRALRGFTLGPRVIVALPAIAGSALVAPGTQTYWYSRLRLRDGVSASDWIRGFEQRFPEAGYRIVDAADGVPGVERSMGFVTSLLILLSLGMVLIGGVGVGGAVAAYLDRKRDTIAILKGLGATTATIRRLYLVQIMAASLCGIALGLALGIAVTRAATPLLAGWLPLDPAIRLTSLASAAGFGLLASLIFALWPLARAALLSPQELFRDLLAGERQQRPGWRALAGLVLLAALLLLLLVWSAPLPVVAALFAAGAALAVLGFLLLGRVVAWTAGWAVRWVGGRTRRPLLRLALANLHRPGAPTAPLVLALGLCLTLLVAVTSVRDNAAAHLQDTLPATAPDLILLNLPPEEAARFDALMAAEPALARWSRAPFLHGRLDRVGGVPVADLRIPAEIGFVVRGDRGLSWRADPPAGGLVAGDWWPADYQGPPLLSVDARVAEKLGVTVGDLLTLNVLGEPLEGRIANLRRVDWAGLDLDFPILLSPPADPPPHREIAALWLSEMADEQALAVLRAALADAFPESPTIEVAEVIGFLAGVAARGGQVMTALAAASGFAALLVLAGAVLAGQRRRAREAVLLKMLGATRRQLAAATLLEYGLIAVAAGLAALLLGNLAAWAAIGGWLDFWPALGSALVWLAGAVAVMALAGLAALNRALARPPALMLRQG
ncbi:MAG: FtsX-like permease family protein [Oceanibaculum nanhaiense]|uniref:ABC transporter permease n=1 Tax=Oceanibaculum nanhaiense TaxID=1909734 RepID=UPI0025A37ECB|nr:FtsX-like permease family protein [Oceanibaculum nanhaiense]MDM7945033.1 FtsX-like permease family protein [Oceanibaculum nanhaiense]